MLIGNIYKQYLGILQSHNGEFSIQSGLPKKLLIEEAGKFSVYYAPFDALNADARVVLVGITPGVHQAINALKAAKQALDSGASDHQALTTAKTTASFSGSMRTPLIAMLDHISLQRVLGICTCADLFGVRRDLLHSTSVLRYPVLYDGKNYSGSPDMIRTKFLRRQLQEQFNEEATALPDAIYVPLGPKVSAALEYLAESGVLSSECVISGIPHPSGANAERVAYFLGRKVEADLSVKTNPTKIDGAKRTLIAKIDRLASAGQPKAKTEKGESIMCGSSTRTADNLLRKMLAPLKTPTQKIAGFTTKRGRELALERNRMNFIGVWAECHDAKLHHKLSVEYYDHRRTRNSNLRSNAPKLATGNTAYYYRFTDVAALEDFVRWYELH